MKSLGNRILNGHSSRIGNYRNHGGLKIVHSLKVKNPQIDDKIKRYIHNLLKAASLSGIVVFLKKKKYAVIAKLKVCGRIVGI